MFISELFEAFDQPYPLTWEKSTVDKSIDALARLPDGSNLSIMFNQDLDDEGEGIYSVEFWRNNSQEVTGGGDAQRVFATVLAAIAQFVKKRKPEQLYFSADKDGGNSRSNLYTNLVKRYAHDMGYEADVSDFAGSTTYKLHRLYEQNATESVIKAQKIFFARSNKAPVGWSYDHIGFITQDGKQIQMSGHKGNDVYTTNAVTDDPEFPTQNIKIVPLSKPVTVPTTNSVGAENCGTFVANVLALNGIKNINTQKIYSVFKQPLKQSVKEVTLVPTVAKGKREHLDVMPNEGKPIPAGEESHYMGKKIGDIGPVNEIWTYNQGPMRTFVVYNPETRISQLAVTGSSYPNNPNSLIIKGVYSGPKNQTRAADLYAWLVGKHGLTLVSDIKQSTGGYRVWQELEQRYGRQINIHGFNTKTNEPVNVGTKDEPETHVGQSDINRDTADVAKNVRLVASPK